MVRAFYTFANSGGGNTFFTTKNDSCWSKISIYAKQIFFVYSLPGVGVRVISIRSLPRVYIPNITALTVTLPKILNKIQYRDNRGTDKVARNHYCSFIVFFFVTPFLYLSLSLLYHLFHSCTHIGISHMNC